MFIFLTQHIAHDFEASQPLLDAPSQVCSITSCGPGFIFLLFNQPWFRFYIAGLPSICWGPQGIELNRRGVSYGPNVFSFPCWYQGSNLHLPKLEGEVPASWCSFQAFSEHNNLRTQWLKPYWKRPWFAGYSIQTTVLSFPTKYQRIIVYQLAELVATFIYSEC